MKLHENVINKKSITNFKTLQKRCMTIHGDLYNYSKFIYLNNNNKSTIICKQHGEWQQSMNSHLQGRGCPKCGIIKQHMKLKSRIEDVVKKANSIHANKYDYSKFKYTNTLTKSIIICPIHGEWSVSMGTHLQGVGCPKCADITRASQKRNNIDDVIRRASITHNNKYDYSEFVYINIKNKSKIICPFHGAFKQRFDDHLRGQGCPDCAITKSDNDCVYIWRIKGTDVYKMGVTSYKLGHHRIKRVARRHNVSPIILAYKRVDNAFEIEAILHNKFKTSQDIINSGDGYTEFKTLNNQEVIEALNLLNDFKTKGK